MRTNPNAARRHARDHADRASYHRPRRRQTAAERAENERQFQQQQQQADERLREQMQRSFGAR